jgi:hypothetical protein
VIVKDNRRPKPRPLVELSRSLLHGRTISARVQALTALQLLLATTGSCCLPLPTASPPVYYGALFPVRLWRTYVNVHNVRVEVGSAALSSAVRTNCALLC